MKPVRPRGCIPKSSPAPCRASHQAPSAHRRNRILRKAPVAVLRHGEAGPAATKAAQVDMLYDPEASPPVPTMSIAPEGASTRNILSRMTSTAPVISSTLSPRPQRHQQSGNLSRRRLARHEHVERDLGLLSRQRLAVGGLCNEGLEFAHRFTPPCRGSSSECRGRARRQCFPGGTGRRGRSWSCVAAP